MTSRSKSKFLPLYSVLIVVLSITLSGCVQPQNETALLTTPLVDTLDTELNSKAMDPQTTDPELWPAREISPARDPLIEQRAAKILQAMSVPEKVGQMIQPELKYITPAEVKKFHIGSVLNGGGTTPNNDKFATVQDWANLAEQFYQASTDESDGKAGIPLIWGSDAVHGNNNVYGMTLFPHNIGLGAAGDPELLYRIGQVTALEVAVTGVDWTFGPTVAVARDVRWGRTYESYS
jgi:beta-glucosidase